MEPKNLKLNQKGVVELLLVIVVLAVVGVMIYFFSNSQVKLPGRNSQSSTATNQGAFMEKTSKYPDIVVDLASQSNSNQVGIATITKSGDGLVVKLDLKSVPNTSHPAHIHVGACPNPGAVKYPLTSVVNGMSETTLNVSLDTLKQSLPLAINVHKSEAEANVYVACGDVKP